MNAQRARRRGAALLMAVTCVALLVLVFGTLMRTGFAARGQARAQERRTRALWLAESGLERAWSKLSASADYRGETWELSAETLHGRDGAVVRIVVEPMDNGLRVTSRADSPREGTSRARQTRSAFFPVNPKTNPRSGANP